MTRPGATGPARDKFYGRRAGKSLRAHHARLVAELLPRVRVPAEGALDVPKALFGGQVDEVWLEIGFGGGEHLAWQAAANPRVGIIGAEPFTNGVAKLLTQIEEEQLSNIRIWDEDIRPRLPEFPDASIARAFLLFPDPWPKPRHHKRRFVNQTNLAQLHRILKPGAEFRVGSDIDHYVRWTLREVSMHGGFEWTADTPADWRVRPADWPRTRYEAKADREGRRSAYLSFRRI